MRNADIHVRDAKNSDRQRLANLIHFGSHVHRHLDWKAALDWLGSPPFVVAERGDQILAAFACPPEPPTIPWLRLFGAVDGFLLDEAWLLLWNEAQRQLVRMGLHEAYVLAIQDWFVELMKRQPFVNTQDVIVLAWEGLKCQLKAKQSGVSIRAMQASDLPRVSEVDNLAFEPEWRNSLAALQTAYGEASIATVAETEYELVGYQISTASPMGGHLARLAVCPASQGKGVGSALVSGLMEAFLKRGIVRATVNTQTDNQASLAIYRKCGFKPTGEIYPVFRLDVQTS